MLHESKLSIQSTTKNDVFNTYKHPPVVTGGQQKKENKIAPKTL